MILHDADTPAHGKALAAARRTSARWARVLGHESRLGVRLVVASLLVGSVLSVFTTGAQIGTSFVRQRDAAAQVLDRIDATLLPSLEQAVWTFNTPQIDALLDGLMAEPNVSYVALSASTGQVWTRGTLPQPKARPDPKRSFALERDRGLSQIRDVGQLEVHLSLDAVRARVLAQFWTTFLTNLAKAYLAALVLLFLVQHLIMRHLRKIADHVQSPALMTDTPLKLDRRAPRQPDEISHIADAVEQFRAQTETQMVEMLHEIQEREKAEARAQRALSIRTQFLANMSHEIRTPLNAIMGFLHLIESHEGTGEKPKLYAETATRAAHQLLRQLNNTLDLARIESDVMPVQPAPIDLREQAQAWLSAAQAIAYHRGRSPAITLEIAEDVPETFCTDADHLSRVVTNLVDNAIKFSDNARVDIRLMRWHTAADAPGLEVSVSNTGKPVPDSYKSEIFKRFVQADDGIDRQYGGSGLGLAICREVAELIHGRLTLRENALDGYDTTFSLQIVELTQSELSHDTEVQSSPD